MYSTTAPVNIYVYRNGIPQEKPQLVHIPLEKKRNMNSILQAIQTRMHLPMGYPIALYNMDGTRVFKPSDLQMYNNYVVVTNLEKRFKKVDYGKVKDPLVVIGKHSKHVSALINAENRRKYDPFRRRKLLRRPLHELVGSTEPDGYGPGDMPPTTIGNMAMCNKLVGIHRPMPTQCCSDEIMCVEGDAEGPGSVSRKEDDLPSKLNSSTTFDDPELTELFRKTRPPPPPSAEKKEMPEKAGAIKDAGLVNLIKRYKDVGSEIFKMFQDKIYKDLQQGDAEIGIGGQGKMQTRNLAFEETKRKIKEDLLSGKHLTFHR